ncbi:MAG: hypothetical protein CND89_05575 [Marine Group II euryarchaeote MED-G38]|nr:MAG: hypothetical protein CND89_05575 [Marine Group II euryarchaeote MED-G38]|tara:strand:+ start:9917 stop:10108 length:192 start_codon:yes stop_codon:yes gene_type:complete
MEDDSPNYQKLDKKNINSLIRKSDSLKKILNQAELSTIKQKIIDININLDEIENRMADPLLDN